MAAALLGISGSPVPKSNTDRAVQYILESSGLDYEFIKLSNYDIQPCRACLGCKDDNRCVVKDDAQELAVKFREAKGFVLGAFTPYSSLDARTKAFMERMYCFRHQEGLNRGKPGVAVITSACPPGVEGLPPALDTASAQIKFWMMEEEMECLGILGILGNVPCIRCGYGDQCSLSGIAMMHGPGATVESVGVRRFEDCPQLIGEAQALGKKLAQARGE